MIPRGLEWLEERTGLPSAIEHFMNEEVPASAGWHQVFGSVALFLLYGPGVHRNSPRDELRADARRSIQQRQVHRRPN